MSSTQANWLGIDIGGANLKGHYRGVSASLPFELWQQPQMLAPHLRELGLRLIGKPPSEDGQLTTELPESPCVAVTMTGELCDCFASREAGVAEIVRQTGTAFEGQEIRFYQTSGNFVEAERAVSDWLLTAASNWHALARAAARFLPSQSGIIVDIGSTTTDLVPVTSGDIDAVGTTDFGRLSNGELIYTGVDRSPVCAVARTVRLFDREIMLAQEWFATMADVFRILGKGFPGSAGESASPTCDGRPPDRAHSLIRLARCLCSDLDEIGEEAIVEAAEQIAYVHFQTIRRGLRELVNRSGGTGLTFLVAGQGEQLAVEVIKSLESSARMVRLSERLDSQASQAAAAWAVARLAADGMP